MTSSEESVAPTRGLLGLCPAVGVSFLGYAMIAALGNNAALVVLGEIIGTSGGSFIAGVDAGLSLIIFNALALLAAAAFRRPTHSARLATVQFADGG